MAKILTLAPEKCTGCRTCELACSFKHTEEFRPSASRVWVLTAETAGVSVPLMCTQCDTAACMKVCPRNAISKAETGALVVDESRCIQCKMCIMVCPFGNTGYDEWIGKIIKCDLCEGEPACAKFCPSGAITYKEVTVATLEKKKLHAEKVQELLKEVKE